MTPIEVLSKANELLDKPEKWTQKNYAIDIKGEAVCPTNETAVAWCISGACSKVLRETCEDCSTRVQTQREIFQLFKEKIGPMAQFNDSHTFEEVKAALAKCIETSST